MADRIGRQRLEPPPPQEAAGDGADTRAAVVSFAGGLLTASQPARPATAEAFASALRARVPCG